MRLRFWIAALILGLLLVLLWSARQPATVAPPLRSGDCASLEGVDSSPPGEDPNAPSPTPSTDAAFRRSAPSPPRASTPQPPAAGTLRFEIREPRRGALLDSVELRVLSATRFGTYRGRGRGQVLLSADSYEVAILARGLETLRLSDVSVHAERTTDLGTLWLKSGRGIIAGAIAAPRISLDQPITVELFGRGRSPCAAHRGERIAPHAGTDQQPCRCGYTPGKTTRVLKGTRTFTFADLAAGTYYLRARCKAARYGEPHKVVLAPQGAAWISLPLVPDVAVTFFIARASGGPCFTRTWLKVPPTPSELPEEEEEVEEGALLFAFHREKHLVACADVVVYEDLLSIVELIEEEEMKAGSRKAKRIDHRRTRRDALVPAAPPPASAVVPLHSERRDASTWTLSPLPAAELTVRASFAGASTGPIPLDLRSWRGGIFPLVMKSASKD